MYHEYRYHGRLERRNYSGSARFDLTGYPDPPELVKLMAQLRERLGPEAYYRWATGLGMRVLLDPQAYIRAIKEQLAVSDPGSDFEQLSFLPSDTE